MMFLFHNQVMITTILISHRRVAYVKYGRKIRYNNPSYKKVYIFVFPNLLEIMMLE